MVTKRPNYHIILLRNLSIAVLVGSFALPLIYIFVAAIGRRRRTVLSLTFPALMPITIIILSASVLIQAGIFAYSVYLGESYFTGYIHPKLIFVIALVGILGALALIQKLVTFFSPQKMTVVGELLIAESCPRLNSVISSVCSQLGASKPHNVIVGLEPNFYATNCRVEILGRKEKLHGNTLYISALLLRFLNENELSAVIAHEMGHFSGKDTVYTLRFAVTPNSQLARSF